jgi:bisphosphoglycerate-independent phosphoglycerate mutase (AlkP superfamily)
LTVFEYWLTDHAGHSKEMKFAVEVLERLDEFLAGYFERFDESESLFLMISDHGNIEDLSVKSHTRNKVPCILAGREKGTVARRIRDLTDVTPAILQLLSS